MAKLILKKQEETNGSNVLENLIVKRAHEQLQAITSARAESKQELTLLHEEMKALSAKVTGIAQAMEEIKVLLHHVKHSEGKGTSVNSGNKAASSNMAASSKGVRSDGKINMYDILKGIKCIHRGGEKVLAQLFSRKQKFDSYENFQNELKASWKTFEKKESLIALRNINTFCEEAWKAFNDAPAIQEELVTEKLDEQADYIRKYSKDLKIDSDDIVSLINQIKSESKDWLDTDGKLIEPAVTQLTEIWELDKFPKREVQSFFRFIEESVK